MNASVDSKDRVHISLSRKHCSLQAFLRHVVESIVEQVGQREEDERRGLES